MCCWTFTLLFWAYWPLVWVIQPALQKSVSTCCEETSFQPVLYVLLFWAYWLLVWSIQPALEKSASTCLQDTSFLPTLHLFLDFHATALGISVTSCLIDQFSYFAIFNCCFRLVRHTLEDNKDIWRTSFCSGALIPKAWIQGWSRQSLVVHSAFVIGLECSCRYATVTALKLCLTYKLCCWLSNRNRHG